MQNASSILGTVAQSSRPTTAHKFFASSLRVLFSDQARIHKEILTQQDASAAQLLSHTMLDAPKD